MRVVVKFHELARADYEAWLTRLSQPPTGNPGVARVHAEELIRQFQQHAGTPPAAKLRADLDPPGWTWRYSADTWVRFVVREVRSGMWGGSVIEVIVTELANQPPG